MSAFTFGDILTLIRLGVNVAKSLDNASGSASEYRGLVQELAGLRLALEFAQSMLKNQLKEGEMLDEMTNAIERCRATINTFILEVKPYEQALGSPDARGGRTWLRKIWWRIFKSKDVVSLQRKL